MSDTAPSRYPVIVYDGDCVFCSKVVQRVLKADHASRFYFTARSSVFSSALLQQLNRDQFHSLVVVEKNRLYEKSDAAFRIWEILGGPWKLLLLFRWWPRNIRDGVYDFVARHRYRIAGRQNSCFLAGPSLSHRFIP